MLVAGIDLDEIIEAVGLGFALSFFLWCLLDHC